MNYRKIYYKIINNAKLQKRDKKTNYYEKHHIIPKSVGGDNTKDNLVLLTAREHFICHFALTKFYNKNSKEHLSMLRSFMMMKGKNKNHKRYYNSRLYSFIREESYGENGLLKGKNHSFYGKTHTDENKNKLSERMKNNNPMKGKIPWNKGLTSKTSEKVANYGKNVSKTKIDSKRKLTKKEKNNLSQIAKSNNLGKNKTQEQIEKIRKSLIEYNKRKKANA